MQCPGQASPLPYETSDNTGKEIVFACTHNTNELQVMKCNQFCIIVNLVFQSVKNNYLNLYVIIQNGQHVSCVVLYGRKIKSNAELYVIHEKSVLIPVNHEFWI